MSIHKFVVTGASGFVGRNLIEYLKTYDEFQIYAFSSRGDELQSENDNRNIKFFHKNSLFSDKGRHILADAIVVNCAFPRNNDGKGLADGLKYIQRLFIRSKECGVRAIINISSQSVYSQMRVEAATEETPLSLDNAYAVGKYATELMLESIFQGTSTKFTNLRMSSLIGPGFDQRIVNKMILAALQNGFINAYESERKFGFLDIDDAVKAIMTLLTSEGIIWREIYNVGNGIDYSAMDIAGYIAKVFGEKMGKCIEIKKTKTSEFGTTATSGKIMAIDFGFTPTIHMLQSIQKILESIIEKEIMGT